ncbi:RHS repeat-associated core domain-containing protein [Labrys sp. La1]|uniref:RHS repeat-associated core domain-containing protein n=1 Tax=Labrys sp. La1 TaxID=3404917 RepID=UPI003EBE6C74
MIDWTGIECTVTVIPTVIHGALALKDESDVVMEARFLCPIRFQGQWEDEESGLYYNRFRYYDPLAGQYVSRDPIGIHGGYKPQGYVPVPANGIDPLGLALCQVKAKVSAGENSVIGESGKGIHAEIDELRQLNAQNALRGQDVIISDITGMMGGERGTAGMCAGCRANIFDELIAGGAKSVTFPQTIGGVTKGVFTIPASSFSSAQSEVQSVLNAIGGTRRQARSDAAWEALKKIGDFTPCGK